MPLRSDWSGEQCPIARSLEILGDPWVLLVLRQAFSGVRRFDQLRSELTSRVSPAAANRTWSKCFNFDVDADPFV